MRLFRYFVIFIMICSLFSCGKKNPVKTEESITVDSYEDIALQEAEEKPSAIDFDKMQSIVDKSKSMDVEVFFAISVLHRKYILSFEDEAAKLPESQRAQFYETKRKAFFETVKYSEKQYNDFVTNHTSELNNYINQFPDIAQYLTTTN